MKTSIVFFASIREALGVEQIDIELTSSLRIDQLVSLLVNEHGDAWSVELNRDNVLIAVNQTMVERHHSLNPGDEIAFFPPVTGG